MNTNIFNHHDLISIDKVGTGAIKFTYSKGQTRVVNSLIWSTFSADTDHEEPASGRVNFFQAGGVSGTGIAGFYVSVATPLTVDTVSMNTIAAVEAWLIANLT